jgi:hypothetical protein
MSTIPSETSQLPAAQPAQPPAEALKLRIFSHSPFFYWWPLWVFGFLLIGLMAVDGVQVPMGPDNAPVTFHHNKSLGVFYTLLLFCVILTTSISLRGLSSITVIIAILFIVVLFAYFDWWSEIVRLFPYLAIYMNLGFYVFFSTLLFIAWVYSFVAYDRLTYWQVQPGQVTQEQVIGGGQKTYNTEGMIVEKLPQDLFRNYLFGFGSGDIHIVVNGAKGHQEEIIRNVLFVNQKVVAMQRLIAIKPDQISQTVS